MKLGTVLAFCAGAAVVMAGQHFIGGPGQPSKASQRTRSSDSCEALALLKSTRDVASNPKVLTESPPPTQSDSASPDAGDASPPTSTPPLPERYDDAQPEARAAPDDSPRLLTGHTALDPNLLGLTLPSVSPKVTGDFQLPKADDPPPADPIAAAQRVTPANTLPVFADPTPAADRNDDQGNAESTAPTVSVVRQAPNLAETDAGSTEPGQATAELAAAPADSQQREVTTTEKPAAPVEGDAAKSDTAENNTAKSDGVSPEQMEALKTKIRRVLDHHRHRMLNTRDHGAWETMHSFIAYGVDKELQIGGPGGKKVNAIGWVCFNGPCAGERLFTQGSMGPSGRTGPGLQGHEGQFLAMLAQCRVASDYPMKVDGRDYTVMDLVRQEQSTCRPASELTFKLIGLMHYLKSDDTWRDASGGEWDIPRLIREELAQPIIGATCGGTHRLFGLTYAYKKRQQRGEPVTGQYRRAQVYIKDFQDYTFNLQNPDGSFSTAFFAGRGNSPDPQRRLETTGHITEWLTFSLDEDQLRDPRMVRAIDYLATLLDSNPGMQWKVGPLGHALHALNMYDSYVFGGTAYPKPTEVASETRRTAAAPRASADSSTKHTAEDTAP